MPPYDHAHLEAKYLGAFADDDFAVFWYQPKWRERFEPANDTTVSSSTSRTATPRAIATVAAWSVAAFERNEAAFRDDRASRFVVAIPRSGAGIRNVGAEAVAAAMAARFPYLTHLPGALERTESVPASHLGERPSFDRHVETMAYRGGLLAAPDRSTPTCSRCRKTFRTPGGLAWHYENIHRIAASTHRRPPAIRRSSSWTTSGTLPLLGPSLPHDVRLSHLPASRGID